VQSASEVSIQFLAVNAQYYLFATSKIKKILTFSIVPPKYLKRRNTTINMLKVIDVVYEKGIFKPLEKVETA
jgi:hypothetical protein